MICDDRDKVNIDVPEISTFVSKLEKLCDKWYEIRASAVRDVALDDMRIGMYLGDNNRLLLKIDDLQGRQDRLHDLINDIFDLQSELNDLSSEIDRYNKGV